jgi:hypothetical protein
MRQRKIMHMDVEDEMQKIEIISSSQKSDTKSIQKQLEGSQSPISVKKFALDHCSRE